MKTERDFVNFVQRGQAAQAAANEAIEKAKPAERPPAELLAGKIWDALADPANAVLAFLGDPSPRVKWVAFVARIIEAEAPQYLEATLAGIVKIGRDGDLHATTRVGMMRAEAESALKKLRGQP